MKNLSIRKGLVPVIAVVAGFLLGAIIMLVFGYNPLWGYEDLLTQAFGNSKSIGEIFRSMGPLTLTALSFAVAMKAGMINIGMSGQALAGWISSVWFALSFPDLPRAIMIPLVIIIGAAWGASSVPQQWREIVHGWPGLTGEQYADLGKQIVDAANREI